MVHRDDGEEADLLGSADRDRPGSRSRSPGSAVELRRRSTRCAASRARIVAAADQPSGGGIERDLHDGAQQRLVSHRPRAAARPARAGRRRRRRRRRRSTRPSWRSVPPIDELRELAHGLRPAQLDGGLAPAFRDLARRSPVPVEVRATTRAVRSGHRGAAYFIGCEGLTNAVKHARADRRSRCAPAARGRPARRHRVADDGSAVRRRAGVRADRTGGPGRRARRGAPDREPTGRAAPR